jgi:pantetheine-phosphate adenylyltransferase
MEKMVYPGSFDPITLGHVDIIRRAASLCDELIVAVLVNPGKQPVFTIEERVGMISRCLIGIENVSVKSFDGLLAQFIQNIGARAIIKGLRAVSDYEYELQMAHMNKKLNLEMETLFMMASLQYSFLSSSIVKDVARYGGDISEFIPEEIIEDVYAKFRRS